MRLLIDECLHTSLVEVANAAGHEAYHVAHLGLAGLTDRALMRRVRDGDYTLVSNNAIDFRRLYRREELHAGLILIVTQVEPEQQRLLFSCALNEVGTREILNTAVEVELVDEEVVISEYSLP